MKTFQILLFGAVAVLAPARLCATRLDACNKGQFLVSYATAERHGSFLTGHTWVLNGWHQIKPGDCANLYATSFGTSGNIHVAFAFTDSTGTSGAPDRNITRFQHSDKNLCVTDQPFNYTLSDGELGGSCRKGYYPLPALVYLEPTDQEGIDSFGNCLGCYHFDFALTSKDRAIPAGPQSSSTSTAPAPVPAGSSDAPTVLGVLGQLGGAMQASRQRERGEFVQESFAEAANRFENLRLGEARAGNDGRVWDLNDKSGRVEGCSLTEHPKEVSLVCTLGSSTSRQSMESAYAEWVAGAIAALPRDWHAIESAPGSDGLPNKIFRSASGMEGYIWMERPAGSSGYGLFLSVIAPR